MVRLITEGLQNPDTMFLPTRNFRTLRTILGCIDDAGQSPETWIKLYAERRGRGTGWRHSFRSNHAERDMMTTNHC
jgi:hypothetical protein